MVTYTGAIRDTDGNVREVTEERETFAAAHAAIAEQVRDNELLLFLRDDTR